MRQLSPQDAFMYYRESPKAPYNITFVNIYDRSTVTGERLTFDRIQEGMQDRLHLAKAFRQKLVPVAFNLDHPYWVEDAN
ncbi:MAG: hypothetical protein JWM76_3091, partial [Pseudonocardiales bacterium]|nr:hypothetical protein [Pseudonocardiales bacterium]